MICARLYRRPSICLTAKVSPKSLREDDQDSVKLRRSLVNKRKTVGDRTDPCGTPQLIGLEEEQ